MSTQTDTEVARPPFPKLRPAQRLKRWRKQRSLYETTATCPNDDWTFKPRYTDGVCPLCGWKAEGVEFSPPLSERLDWFWPSLVVFLIASVIMGVLVFHAYSRGK